MASQIAVSNASLTPFCKCIYEVTHTGTAEVAAASQVEAKTSADRKQKKTVNNLYGKYIIHVEIKSFFDTQKYLKIHVK